MKKLRLDLTVTQFAVVTVRSNLVDHLGLPDFLSIFKCLSRH